MSAVKMSVAPSDAARRDRQQQRDEAWRERSWDTMPVYHERHYAISRHADADDTPCHADSYAATPATQRHAAADAATSRATPHSVTLKIAPLR